MTLVCCELLQNVYLCISTYNHLPLYINWYIVVNCFKMCIFALARTTSMTTVKRRVCCELLQNVYLCISTYNLMGVFIGDPLCCELLQNVYLCISTYNRHRLRVYPKVVVNCFKMCIFALARTTKA